MSEVAGSEVRLPLQQIEAQHLGLLVEQFLELLSDTEIGQDAALNRLTPAVYPQDPNASAEFAHATSADLLDRRAADARVVQAGLGAFAEGIEPNGGELLLRPSEVDPWLRTLSALRLVIASRLGIEDGPSPDPEDPGLGVYEWLGYRLDLLVTAADELDDE